MIIVNKEREASDIQLMKCAADKGYPKTGIILRFGASVGGCVLAAHTFSLGVRMEISAVGAGEIMSKKGRYSDGF